MDKLPRKDYEYLLGVYLGDGTHYNKYGIKLTVSQHDPEYKDLLVKLMKPLNPRVVFESNCYRIFAGKKDNDLSPYFNHYKEKGVFTLPKLQYPLELIAGLFDTDGSIRKRPHRPSWEIVIWQKHKENLEPLIPFLEKANIYMRLHKWHSRDRSPMYFLICGHWSQIKAFHRSILIRHPRKKKILNQVAGI